MAATLTLRLDAEALSALRSRSNRTITLNVAGGGSALALLPAKGRRKPGRKAKGSKGLREGSHAARLVAWASKRAKPFSTPEAAKALKIKRNHAMMVIAEAVRKRVVVREARGVYAVG